VKNTVTCDEAEMCSAIVDGFKGRFNMFLSKSFSAQVGLGFGILVSFLVKGCGVGSESNASTQAVAGFPKAFDLLAQCKVDNETDVRLTTDGTRITEISGQTDVTSYILTATSSVFKIPNSSQPAKTISDISTSNGSHYSIRSLVDKSGSYEVYKNGAYYGPCVKGFVDTKILALTVEKYKIQKPKFAFATCRTNNAGGQIDITVQEGPVASSVIFEGTYDKGDGQETMVLLANSFKETATNETVSLQVKGQGSYAHYGLGYHPRSLNTLTLISPKSIGQSEGTLTSDANGKEDFAQNCVVKNVRWVKQRLAGVLK
jgi:hypothetical protein